MEGCNHWVEGRPARRINPSVMPVCGYQAHALVDRGMPQYWLVRSPDFCLYASGKPFAASLDRRNDWSGPHRLPFVRGRRILWSRGNIGSGFQKSD